MATMNMRLTAVPLGAFMGQDISIMVFSWVWAHGITGVIGMAGVTVASVVLVEGVIALVTDPVQGLATDPVQGLASDPADLVVAGTMVGDTGGAIPVGMIVANSRRCREIRNGGACGLRRFCCLHPRASAKDGLASWRSQKGRDPCIIPAPMETDRSNGHGRTRPVLLML